MTQDLDVGRYITASMDGKFKKGEGTVGCVGPPLSLSRLGTNDAKAWAAPPDVDRRAASLAIGVRHVYVLCVTERCVLEFAGLAGAEPLKTDQAKPLLLRFAAKLLRALVEAEVIDAFEGALHEATPTPPSTAAKSDWEFGPEPGPEPSHDLGELVARLGERTAPLDGPVSSCCSGSSIFIARGLEDAPPPTRRPSP
jgi:hypothetical protein